ncbi:MAG: hypothetical protein ABEI13_01095, partial [Candidatus Paceibacteria bacterium]
RILEAEEDDSVTLAFSESQVMVSASTAEIISKLIEGNFPQYEGLIPQDFKYRVAFQKEEMRQAIQLASVFSTESAHDIKMQFDPEAGGLSVQSSNSEIGQNSSRVPVQLELGQEEAFAITFNYHYLLDGLSISNGERITFALNDADSPAVMRDAEDDSLLYLVMPIRE